MRRLAIELLSRIVQRSPVGNLELWSSNSHVLNQRATYNDEVARTNSLIDAHPELALKYGKLKKQRTLSARTIAKRLPLTSGKGYVGGRFRSSWVVSVGAPSSASADEVVLGAATIAAGIDALTGFTVGPPIYIQNNLPYATRLEFGWSTQAPSGMVRVTLAELNSIFNAELAK